MNRLVEIGPASAVELDAAKLEKTLRAHVRGEVRFDRGSRALYATDGSNYRQVPIGIVIPRTVEDLLATVATCKRFGAPLLSRGGGTSLAGQCCNTAVVLDFSKYLNQIVSLDAANRTATVQPGVVLDTLRDAAENHHLTFAPDPSTHAWCTLGGMIGNNSCGVHSVKYGKTAENLHELEVLTYAGSRLRVGATREAELESIIAGGGPRGEIYARLRVLRDRYADRIRRKYPKIPRRVSGYNLDQLLPENGFHVARALVGSEGTCVTVLEAKVQLVPSARKRCLLVLGYEDVYVAADNVPEILKHEPLGLEGIDDLLTGYMKKKNMHPAELNTLPEGRGWLLVEFGGDTIEEAEAAAQSLMRAVQGPAAPSMKLITDARLMRKLWEVRESALGATARVPGEPVTWEGWEDSAVPPESLGQYLRDLRRLLQQYGYGCSLYGHFGDGCVHTRIDFDFKSKPGVAHFRRFVEDAADLVVEHGGSLSGEHGDGQSRAELLSRMFGPELVEAFREFKRIWDPDCKMNPGKVVDPYRLDENLRLAAPSKPNASSTHFQFPDDTGSLASATERCVGVGRCRRLEGGVMCPSFMVTREEKHSTRGRAHLLFEMLRGDTLVGGWRDPHVKEALDLCLSCKGCKSDCPVNVDVATYKAEFLSHYYAGRLRPRHHYVLGMIDRWVRGASIAPRLANLMADAPGLAGLAKWFAGIAPERMLPSFARETFQRQWRRRKPTPSSGPPVLLWPDTFTNHFSPEIAWSAVQVLESLGYRVEVPSTALCCGRPLYDFGMLRRAKRLLRNVMQKLASEIDNEVPIVGLEPSCVAVFRDELPNLLADDPRAKQLSRQVRTLGEFIAEQTDAGRMPRMERRAIVQGHCHHRSVLNFAKEEELLRALGLDISTPEPGCCGMAGSFGFLREHYEISQAIAETRLLPAVRDSGDNRLLIADGFSCREQIRQATGRQPLHLAQVLELAMKQHSLERVA